MVAQEFMHAFERERVCVRVRVRVCARVHVRVRLCVLIHNYIQDIAPAYLFLLF